MLTFDDIAEWAGPEGMVQADRDTAAGWAISDGEKQALVEVGLPRFVDPFFEARIQSSRQPSIHSTSSGDLYQIGWDMGREMGVASAARGVYAVDPEGELPELFVNSSAVQLVEFLHYVGQLRQEYPRMTDEQIDSSLADLKARLTKIDERAFKNAGDWWSQVFEQMELGMY
jgi:SUKH-4 immunity protein